MAGSPSPLHRFGGCRDGSESFRLGNARAVGFRVARGPSVTIHEWRTGRHCPGGTRAVGPPGSTLAVSARLTHGPSEPEWRPGRQSPNGARAVSSPSGSRAVTVSPRDGSRAVSSSSPEAHGPSVPEWRTGRQYPSGARAVSPPGRRAHGPSIPQVAHGPSVPQMAHGPSVPERPTDRQYPDGSPTDCLGWLLNSPAGGSWPAHPCARCGYRPGPLVGSEVVAMFDRIVSVLIVDWWLAFQARPSRQLHPSLARGVGPALRRWCSAGPGPRRVVGSLCPSRRLAPRFHHLSAGVSRTGRGTY